MKPSKRDIEYMGRAIELAMHGKGRTSPNPAVGCVIVKNNRVIGEGYHKKAGGPHAEIAAIKSCKSSPSGATAYVTLEPCNHHGRTGPCSLALINAGISEVVIGLRDTSPKKGRRGSEALRRAGVTVRHEILKNECARLVEDFLKHSSTGIPFVTLKAAWTLDGKIATDSGDSKWISSPQSRRLVHDIRNQVNAVIVGSQTVIADDPELTVRYGTGRRNPMRVVIDGGFVTPLKSKIVQMAQDIPTLIFTSKGANADKINRLERGGVEVVISPHKGKHVRLSWVLAELGRRDVMYAMVESGGALASALVDQGLVDRGLFFIAPKLAGGKYCALGDLSINKMSDSIELNNAQISNCGPDIVIEADFTST
jgi:diaminohydroxyphosphoribosylaminopyrimidine deaminase/5-amino-6-(5-phosphoribosylamino)uracil reductase